MVARVFDRFSDWLGRQLGLGAHWVDASDLLATEWLEGQYA